MNTLIITSLLSIKISVDAFSFVPVSQQVVSSSLSQYYQHQQQLSNKSNVRYITSLFAEEGEEAEAEPEAEPEAKAKAEEKEEEKASSETDILNSPAFLKRKLEVLKSDVAKLDEKTSDTNKVYEENKAEWGPQIDDLRKEYTNISERMKDKMKAGAGMANIEIARTVLNVLDNYDRAFAAVTPESDEEKEVEAAYKETYDSIVKKFADIGVQPVETVGIEFDYEFHQAVMMRPDEDHEEGIVCEELAKGYKMEDGFLIRAAMVVVAA